MELVQVAKDNVSIPERYSISLKRSSHQLAVTHLLLAVSIPERYSISLKPASLKNINGLLLTVSIPERYSISLKLLPANPNRKGLIMFQSLKGILSH